MRRQPATLDDLGKGVSDVLKVECEAHGRRRSDDTIAVEDDELTVVEQFLGAHPIDSAKQATAQTLERMRMDVTLRERLMPAVAAWKNFSSVACLPVASLKVRPSIASAIFIGSVEPAFSMPRAISSTAAQRSPKI